MEDHIVLVCGLGSSINPKFRKWAYTLADSIGRYYELRQYTEASYEKNLRVYTREDLKLVVHIASSDFNLENRAIEAVEAVRDAGRLRHLVVGGHSNGVRDGCCKLSEKFFPGTPIPYAFAIDTTLAERGKSIFGNVQFLDEFWAGLARVDFDNSFTPLPGENYRCHDLDKIEEREVGHIESASLSYVQEEALRQITTIIAAEAAPVVV